MNRIIPKPTSIQPRGGFFTIRADTVVSADGGTRELARILVEEMLDPAMGRKLHVTDSNPSTNRIALRIDPSLPDIGNEGYCAETENEPLAIGGFTPVEQVYQYEPVPAPLDEKTAARVLGAQGQLWTEYVPGPSHAEYMTYPRACALAEVLWSSARDRDFSEFLPRLKLHLERLKLLGVNYRPLDS
jgi:hypothetical protein